MEGHTVTLERSLPDADYLRATVTTAGGYFSLTGELYESRPNARGFTRYQQGREPDAFGQLTEDVLRAFPQLEPFARLHLADAETGAPMHGAANGWYFYSCQWADSPRTGRGIEDAASSYAAARRTLRVDAIPEQLTREAFASFVDEQRERWAREAREARELLAELAGAQVPS